jgi:ADP-ribose pyrophosphatase YjhB (NUDIX family)
VALLFLWLPEKITNAGKMNSKEKIFEERTYWENKEYFCEYIDDNDFSKISPITQVQALCLLPTGEFVIYKDKSGKCGLPGGTVESRETLKQTLFRELKEEASIRPLEYGPLLYLRITNLSEKPMRITYQVRYWALVESLTDEISDPDGKAVERLFVSESEMLKCLDWGKKLDLYLSQLKKIKKLQSYLGKTA